MAAGDVTAKRSAYSDFPCNVFDGVDDYVEIPHNANQLGANLSNGFTISAWINPRSIGEITGKILDKSSANAGVNGFDFRLTTTNRIGFYINNGTIATCANNGITFGTWTHILITISPAQLANFYVNGVLSGTANQNLVQTISTITTTNAPRIGNRATATDRTFDGGIAKVKMWNKVLSSTEIAEDYAGKRTALGSLIIDEPLGGVYNQGTNSGSLEVTNIPTKLYADVNKTNLAAVTDKLIVLPIEGRDGNFTVLTANRAAA